MAPMLNPHFKNTLYFGSVSPLQKYRFLRCGVTARTKNISIYFGGAGLKNGDFGCILEPVRQKSLCGVGVN